MAKGTPHVYYIKLGTGSQLDITKTCIENNLLYISFKETPEWAIQEALKNEKNNPLHDYTSYDYKNDWEPVRNTSMGKNETVKSTVTTSLRKFYTATEDDYFFTFYNSTMCYCHPVGDVISINDSSKPFPCFTEGERIRTTTGWKKTPITDDSIILSERVISGRITKTKIFRGTICELTGKDKEVFFNTLQWKFPEYEKLESLRIQSLKLILKAIQELNAHDFEILVDMVLTKSGWLRVGESGGTVKAIDMEYYLPITKQTVYVQVKSVLTDTECKDAIESLSKELAFEPTAICYLVFHTDKTRKPIPESNNQLIINTLNGKALAELCSNHQEVINWIFLKTQGMK